MKVELSRFFKDLSMDGDGTYDDNLEFRVEAVGDYRKCKNIQVKITYDIALEEPKQ